MDHPFGHHLYHQHLLRHTTQDFPHIHQIRFSLPITTLQPQPMLMQQVYNYNSNTDYISNISSINNNCSNNIKGEELSHLTPIPKYRVEVVIVVQMESQKLSR